MLCSEPLLPSPPRALLTWPRPMWASGTGAGSGDRTGKLSAVWEGGQGLLPREDSDESGESEGRLSATCGSGLGLPASQPRGLVLSHTHPGKRVDFPDLGHGNLRDPWPQHVRPQSGAGQST